MARQYETSFTRGETTDVPSDTSPRSGRATTIRALVLIAVLAVLAAACVGGNDEGAPTFDYDESGSTALSGSEETTETTMASDFAAPPEVDRDAAASGSSVQLAVYQVANAARDIIYRADMTVAVVDVTAATASAVAAVQGLGGIVFGQQTTSTPVPRSVLTFKVLPEDFQRALDRLGELGDVRTQAITADDVTERVVDLQSRITTAEASVERLRSLLEQAVDITTIAQLENQLLERETQLETLRGQLRTVRDQVALATIIATFVEAETRPAVSLTPTAYPGHEDAGQSCPGAGGIDAIEGDPVTVCFEIVNAGDTPLSAFTLSDPVLGLDQADLITVFGDPHGILEPGQSIMLAAEINLERDLRTRTRVEATPVNADGQALQGRKAADTSTMFLDAVDKGGLPGFRDGLDASWQALANAAGVVVLAAGAALPFVWVALLAAAWLWWRGRRRAHGVGEPPTPAVGVE